MKKNLVVLLSSVIACSLVGLPAACGSDVNEEETDLAGKVQSITTEIARFKRIGGEWTEGPRLTTRKETLDVEGRLTAAEIYDASGRLDLNRKAFRDENGRLTREEDWTPEGRLYATRRYAYTDEGLLKDLDEYKGREKLAKQSVYSYDDGQNPVRQEIYFHKPEGKVRSVVEQAFDSGGRVVESSLTDHFEVRRYRAFSTYNENGNLRKRVEFGVKDELWGTTTYTYGEKGLLAGMQYTDAEGVLVLDASYEYEFDAHGNWTKRLESHIPPQKPNPAPPKPYEVTYRTIVYFE